ncbi:MAG: L-lactate permease, partial [Wenzhouxiangella sp.]|nr:L-lactate permease [Wenzhouxiangella sp.]
AFWPFWAPWFGVLGTFITGSATSSNILFSEFQRSAAEAGGHESIGLLGSQTIGAAIGNMVCPHNIIAAGATVNIQGNEGQVMKYTFPMAAILTTIAGVVALGWV